jgi:hypothetical protein
MLPDVRAITSVDIFLNHNVLNTPQTCQPITKTSTKYRCAIKKNSRICCKLNLTLGNAGYRLASIGSFSLFGCSGHIVSRRYTRCVRGARRAARGDGCRPKSSDAARRAGLAPSGAVTRMIRRSGGAAALNHQNTEGHTAFERLHHGRISNQSRRSQRRH